MRGYELTLIVPGYLIDGKSIIGSSATRRCLEALELKGGDGGACKLLGDVIEVLGCLLEVLGFTHALSTNLACLFYLISDHSKLLELSEKRELWGYLCSLIDRWVGETVILGDFNEVRREQERFGLSFNIRDANAFNNFISMAGLIDIPLGGYSYTWSHKSVSKMSKLDRFLISEGLMAMNPTLSGLCLDRHLSDHRPIIMFESILDYGPTPFRMFHSLFEMEGFDKFVEDSWHSMDDSKSKKNEAKSNVQDKLTEVDKHIHQVGGNDEILHQRATLMKDLHDINSIDVLELSQKAKVRWSIEGDENSKYFYGIINNKRSQLSIRGILIDGDWIFDLKEVKAEFLNHFAKQFSKPSSPPVSIDDIVAAIHQFFDSGKFPPGCNSSFITLIPKIQDAKIVKDFRPINDPFILNELLAWCKHKKVNAMIFKVDFKKAFDSVRWDYLDDVLRSFGFGDKCRKWISGCLNFARGSVLINGSPTMEFQFHKGLRQGDPLSPFIKANHDVRGAMDTQSVPTRRSIWLDLVREFSFLKFKGIDLIALMKRKLGNGESTLFWDDIWSGEAPLKSKFPRLYALEESKSDITSDVLLPQMQDRWSWSLNASGVFSVSSVCNFIDDAILPKRDAPTRWVKLIHIKISILAWKIYLDRLPTRLNLSGVV
ncbi:RNA-directed DNA polymerase, eukaryota [Tanacetum coccineum]